MPEPTSASPGIERLRAFVAEHFQHLSDEHHRSAQEWSRYLMFINAGGAAAVLAYLGTDNADPTSWTARITLGAFIVGLVFVGVSRACWERVSTINLHRLVPLMMKLIVTDQIKTVSDIGPDIKRTRGEARLGRYATVAEWLAFLAAFVALE